MTEKKKGSTKKPAQKPKVEAKKPPLKVDPKLLEHKGRGKDAAEDHAGSTANFEGLSTMQSEFVRHYLILNNAQGAARAAGYKNKQSGNNLLAEPRIAELIKELRKERAKRHDITSDRVLQEVASIAFANIGDVMQWNQGGIKLLRSDEIDELTMRAIQEVSETITGKSTTLKVKMHDKLGALRDLMKHLGLYQRDTEDNKGVDPLEMLKQAIIFSQDAQKRRDNGEPPLTMGKNEDES